ncbi:MAG: histidine kinase, partial [Holophagales bacterium]|nr:histidine kinase [Holophagales bacterium]
VFGVFLYSLTAAVHYLLQARDASRRAQERAYEMTLLARDAELAALRTQLDPHFLFNSLNTISSLTATDPALARTMCLRLAEFLRRSLEVGRLASQPLAEELALADAYLAVERARFGSRLQFVREVVSPEAEAVPIPPLLLQPLVENAVRHGLAHLLGPGEIAVRARLQGEYLHLDVENDCDPERPRRRGAGIGLANVARRLEVAYDGAASATIDDRGESFRVELLLPAAGPGGEDAASVGRPKSSSRRERGRGEET